MPRTRQFDETEAADHALRVFWRRGYDACSVQHLVEATGVKRQSLYNVFGDKAGLFAAALHRYREHVARGLAPLAAPDAGLDAVGNYMLGAVRTQQAAGCGACLIVVTSFTPAMSDPAIRQAVETGAQAVRDAFASCMARARDRGAAAFAEAPTHVADYLYAVLNGLSALAQTGASRSRLVDTVQVALRQYAPEPWRLSHD